MKKTDNQIEFEEALKNKQPQDGFIKVTDNPVNGLTSEQKVVLNRKANINLPASGYRRERKCGASFRAHCGGQWPKRAGLAYCTRASRGSGREVTPKHALHGTGFY